MPTPKGGDVRNAPQNDQEDVDTTGDGAEDRSGSAEDRLSERERLFAAIDAKRNAGVQEDIDYAFSTGDPAAAQAEAARRANAKEAADETSRTTDAAKAPAAGPKKQDASSAPSEAEGGDVDTVVDDAALQLPPEVVNHAGKAHLRLKVDGKEQLVPLDTAIAQLQKGGAAEVRLQQAAELRKQLEARATALSAKEAEINARAARLPSAPPAAADDKDLDGEVQGVVDSLLTDDPKVAAAKLKGVLVKVRQAATPSIDENTIRQVAVQATKTTLREESHAQSLVAGLTKFQTEYPEIAKDPKLERIADSMTDAIATEHPEWTPEQVMLEAGRQTTEWVNSIKGVQPEADVHPAKQSLADTRRDRKAGLRPLPAQRSQRQQATKQEVVQDDPRSIVAEMRRSRGQAV